MAKRKDTAPVEQRADGYANTLTKLGTGYDKRTATVPIVRRLTPQQLERYWRADWMLGRIVEKPADAMTQRGGGVRTQDREVDEAMAARLDELNVWTHLNLALKYARAYGLGAVLMGCEDRLDPRMPLDFNALQQVMHLRAIPREELTPKKWVDDPLAQGFGEVELWEWRPLGVPTRAGGAITIHSSRLLIFRGHVTSSRTLAENLGAGDSVLQRVVELAQDFAAALGGAGALVQDFGGAILKMKGLATLLSTKEGIAKLQQRLEGMVMGRGTIGATVIDAEESYGRETTPVAGLPEIIDRFTRMFSAASDMPMSVLFGEGAAGLNADGEADTDNWHSQVEAMQNRDLRRPLNQFVQALFRAKDGPTHGHEPDKWTVEFHSLRQMTPKQREELRKLVADRDLIYHGIGALDAFTIAKARFGGPEWSPETTVDAAALDLLAEMQAQGEVPPPVPASTPEAA